MTAKSCPDRGTDPVSRGTARAVASTVAASMATSVRWSEEVPETEAPVSYPFRPSGGKFNQSKGPRLYSSVSPTLGEGDTAVAFARQVHKLASTMTRLAATMALEREGAPGLSASARPQLLGPRLG